MKLSFKYKFILSFVSLELIFISLIVFFNFSAINKLSHELNESAVETGTNLFSAQIRTHLIVSDLAEIESAAQGFMNLTNVVAIQVQDDKGNILVDLYESDFTKLEGIDPYQDRFILNERLFRYDLSNVYLDEVLLGKVKVLYEMTDSMAIIETNQQQTFVLIFFEILLSLFFAFVLGFKLTKNLMTLTLASKRIAEDDNASVPQVGGNGDEMSLLANAMSVMQQKLKSRNLNLTNSMQMLQKERDFHSALIDTANSM